MQKHAAADGSVSTMAEELVTTDRSKKGVIVLTLNRPAKRNPLSRNMMSALQEAILSAGKDESVRAIVLAAEGPAFCAGHDLKEMTAHRQDDDGGKAFFEATMTQCSALMQSIVACPKPVIAAAHAMATAAGCQLVATCDLAVAGRSAKFCTPGVNIGLFCSTPMVALSRNVPRKRAMEMLLLGEMLSAEEAAAYGLVNRVVDDGAVLEKAMEFATTIAKKSSVTVAIGKEAFYNQVEQPLENAYGYATQVMVHNMMDHDAEEGIGAFIEKRPPTWKGQ